MFKPKIYLTILISVSLSIGVVGGGLYMAGLALDWLLDNYPQYSGIVLTFIMANIIAFMIYVLAKRLS